MTVSVRDMQSVLDEMTAGIRQQKTGVAKAAGLTPVGLEKGGPLDGAHPGAGFKYDDAQFTQQAVTEGLEVIATLERNVQFVREGLEALSLLYGARAAEPGALGSRVDSDAEAQRNRNREADIKAEAFKAKWEEQKRAAQAAAFSPAPALTTLDVISPVTIVVQPGTGWECPKHGLEKVVGLTSRLERKYRACRVAGCQEFER